MTEKGNCMKHTRMMIEETLKAMEKQEKSCLRLTCAVGESRVVETKVGGLPYLPVGKEIPRSPVTKKPLGLVAQWNVKEIQKSGLVFPLEEGIVQFWYEEPQNDGEFTHKVLFYPTIEAYYSVEELLKKYPHLEGTPLEEGDTEEALCSSLDENSPCDTVADLNDFDDFDDCDELRGRFPISLAQGFTVTLQADSCPMAFNDGQFDGVFSAQFNQLFPEAPITSYEDLEVPHSDLEVFSPLLHTGNLILGYPSFTESDPRSGKNLEGYVLLFQLESEMVDEEVYGEINWGNCATASWLIHPDQLQQGDFSQVVLVL